MQLFTDVVPKTCANFRSLCTGECGESSSSEFKLHYDGSLIHRIVPNGWIQGGGMCRCFFLSASDVMLNCFRLVMLQIVVRKCISNPICCVCHPQYGQDLARIFASGSDFCPLLLPLPSLFLPPLPLCSLHFPSLPSSPLPPVPQIQLDGLGERCKLLSSPAGPRRSRDRKRILMHLQLSKRRSWQEYISKST